MNAHERAAAARARMDQIRREMAERRALRDRNARAARQRALDNLMRQGPVAEQVAKHLGELGRRRKQAGGWATEKTERDKDYIMGFGPEDEQPGSFAYRPAPTHAEPAPGGIGAIEDDAAVVRPAPEPPPARRPDRERRPAPVREHQALDDEDDFSNQSWMRSS